MAYPGNPSGCLGLAVLPTAARGLLPGLLRLWHEQSTHVEITRFRGPFLRVLIDLSLDARDAETAARVLRPGGG